MRSTSLTGGLAWLCMLSAVWAVEQQPVQVFILAGQSNMQGHANVDLDGPDYNDGRGSLVRLLRDPDLAPRLAHLQAADGSWTVRDDVWVRYQREEAPLLAGPLTIGFSVYGDPHHFGPELEFGHVVGDYCDAPVLLVKTAWGGKSLYVDFRPPSSGGEVGPYYTQMIAEVRTALANLETEFPHLRDRGCELAGFVWYQGWNDGVDPEHAIPEYEQNLVNLIHDVRREFDSPDLPVVVGELTGPWVEAPDDWADLRAAQAAAAARPEFAGTVRFAPTHDFVRPAEDSPNPTHGHHEFGNAETLFLVGEALGQAMTGLLAERAAAAQPGESPALSQPTSRTDRQLEGWTIRVDDRLLHGEGAALGEQALQFLRAKLFEITLVVPAERLADLRTVQIVLDLKCGDLGSMQYHPDAGWLVDHGYPAELARCVHLPQAADVATRRNVNEQPWVILHELAHAYHDQFLGFDEPRIVAAYEQYKQGGQGETALLYDGQRVRHYGLTNEKEFFAEMSEAYFGSNDFFPFNRAELQEAEPRLWKLLDEIWNPQVAARAASRR